MSTPPPTYPWQQADIDTPALCRKLAQLLTVWREIEAGRNPVWEEFARLPYCPITTTKIRDGLGNMERVTQKTWAMLAELRGFNLIVTTVTNSGNQHQIKPESWDVMVAFTATLWPASDPHDAIQTTIERCQVIGQKSGLPFALWQVISREPHTSGQAATAVGCSAGKASKALGKLVDCGLAQAPIHKGQFRIYRGIDGLTFLQDTGKLVEAGIIKLYSPSKYKTMLPVYEFELRNTETGLVYYRQEMTIPEAAKANKALRLEGSDSRFIKL